MVQNTGFQVNSLPHHPDLTMLKKEPVENIVGKGENAGNQFSTRLKTNFIFSVTWFLVCKCFQLGTF